MFIAAFFLYCMQVFEKMKNSEKLSKNAVKHLIMAETGIKS